MYEIGDCRVHTFQKHTFVWIIGEVLKDLLESMEEIAYLYSDTADYIKMLGVSK